MSRLAPQLRFLALALADEAPILRRLLAWCLVLPRAAPIRARRSP